MKLKPYSWLRGELQKQGIDEPYFAKLLGRSVSYVSKRLMARDEWPQSEMYRIMDIIQKPYSEMHMYLPLGGYYKEAA